jgi:hypothetical protein
MTLEMAIFFCFMSNKISLALLVFKVDVNVDGEGGGFNDRLGAFGESVIMFPSDECDARARLKLSRRCLRSTRICCALHTEGASVLLLLLLSSMRKINEPSSGKSAP